jgi:hypothetical protein
MIPNRFAEVSAICAAHPDAFPQDERNDSARLTLLRTVIVPELNKIDGGNWGVMTKTNQGGKVPCDILMWRPTREIVDCMTGSGAMWGELPGVPPPEWVWTPVEAPAPEPVPNPPPVVPAISDAFQKEVLAKLEALRVQADANMEKLKALLPPLK